MKKILIKSGLLFALCLANTSFAASFSFSGNITHHNDVVRIGFNLAQDGSNVKLWTDSYNSGANFDPITALWNATTGELIDENDDNEFISLDQTRFDSGFSLPTLSAGSYLFTVATYNNYPSGSNLADGFDFDGLAPILIGNWEQPDNENNLRGPFWRVNLEGVDSATHLTNTNVVPVPAAVWLFGSAITGLLGLRRKKSFQR